MSFHVFFALLHKGLCVLGNKTWWGKLVQKALQFSLFHSSWWREVQRAQSYSLVNTNLDGKPQVLWSEFLVGRCLHVKITNPPDVRAVPNLSFLKRLQRRKGFELWERRFVSHNEKHTVPHLSPVSWISLYCLTDHDSSSEWCSGNPLEV